MDAADASVLSAPTAHLDHPNIRSDRRGVAWRMRGGWGGAKWRRGRLLLGSGDMGLGWGWLVSALVK